MIYKTREVETYLDVVINQEAEEGWKPIFITPVNKIDTTGIEFDLNRNPKRYFYYIITFEKQI